MIIYINKSEARTETELPSQYLIIAEETSPITATDNQQEREANTDTLVYICQSFFHQIYFELTIIIPLREAFKKKINKKCGSMGIPVRE